MYITLNFFGRPSPNVFTVHSFQPGSQIANNGKTWTSLVGCKVS